MTFYNGYKNNVLEAGVDLINDTIKVALVTSSYTFDQDSHENFDDITNEVVGTGYTAGGQALTTKTVTKDNTNDRAVFDADDAEWAASTLTARGAVLYKDTGVASTSRLIWFIDFGGDQTTSAATFAVRFNATDGVFYLDEV